MSQSDSDDNNKKWKIQQKQKKSQMINQAILLKNNVRLWINVIRKNINKAVSFSL